MNIKKIAMTGAVAGAMGAAALGLGAGSAQADHDEWWWEPDIPYIHGDLGFPPGHIGVPPGQLKKWIPGAPPPGHWGR
ncbi:hypothetical protein NIIDNTM18_04910 [Mycolicibacterium litorale]|uniref:Uncharacterized protein n=1 Tax=Mycolicibacterium litorale TaxID=758802 RepID=A0A6S6NVW9_9MYCO|nr:hypothetical protein NIIDNTM18_04910 [Mycolicibacterium litorale]